MGNLTSCFIVKRHKKTMLIDFHGNLREIKVPTTAAEIMILEQPGHLISLVDNDLVSSYRLSALPADEVLAHGKLYLLIPAARLNSLVKDSELEMLRASCKSRKNVVKRRRNSKVLPAEEGEYVMNNEVISEGCVDNLGVADLSLQVHGKRNSSMWTPVLEPIYE